jgi:hypothetical protein
MVSGASEQSDRTALVQRLLRYYAGPSNDTGSDRDIISEHMGHLCVSLNCHFPQLISHVSVVLVHAIRLPPLFRTFAGNLVAVPTSQGSFKPSWIQ